MSNENAFAATSEHTTESIASLADLVIEELSAIAGQAERERDLLLARTIAEYELRLVKLEREVRDRVAAVRDGEKGADGGKGEQGEMGQQGAPGAPGEPGAQGAQGEMGAAGEKGIDG